MNDFQKSVVEAYNAAKEKAEKEKNGDPGTMVSFHVNGNKNFVRRFKVETEQVGEDKWVFEHNGKELVSLKRTDSGFRLSLNKLLEGTDIQKHNKKIEGYREFASQMEERGYECDLSIDSYSY